MTTRTKFIRGLAIVLSGVVFSRCGTGEVTAPSDRSAPTAMQPAPTAAASAFAPEVLVGAGDIGTCANNNDEATAKLLDAIPGTVFTLGDNVYDQGTAAQYQNCYEPTWGRHKARTRPSVGDKEYTLGNADPTYAYFGDRIMGPPGQGYYSYDLGAWHIVVLNSNRDYVPVHAGSVQEQWLRADLAATDKACILAYWHRPLFFSYKTGDGHDDWLTPFWDALYEYGADLVLNGQRHNYERFAPQNPSGQLDPERGIREFIVGTGGKSKGLPPNTRQHSEKQISEYGVLKLTLNDGSYDWQFVPIAGKTVTDAGSATCHGGSGSDPGTPGVSPSQSTISAAPGSIGAGDETSTITVTARDGDGDPVAGAGVLLSATGSGNTISQPSDPTNANGVTTGTIRSTVAQAKTVSATINGTTITQTAAVTVTAGPPSAAQSTVSASPTSISTGGTSTITVAVRDQHGNPIGGSTVVLAATGSGNTLGQPAATNANGVTTGTLTSTDDGTKIVSATADGTEITQTASVAVVPPGQGNITHTLLTSGNSTPNQKIYTTASISPTPNALVTVAVLGHRSTAATSATLSGGGITQWVQVASVDFDQLSLPLKRLMIFRGMSASPGSGPITITFAATVSNAQWIVSEWGGVETSGTNGSGAIGLTSSNRADESGGLTVPLGGLGSSANVAYGVFGVNSSTPAITAGSGYTTIAEPASGENPRAALLAEWAVGQTDIDATWTNLRGGALGVEIKASTDP